MHCILIEKKKKREEAERVILRYLRIWLKKNVQNSLS